MMGFSIRDDVLERGNKAALWPLTAALIGLTACFAGSNIGEGPGVHAVIATSFLSCGSFFFLWFTTDFVAGHRVTESISIDRDPITGARSGFLLLSIGLILGTAAAGDWDADRVVKDFASVAWPAFMLAVLDGMLEQRGGLRHWISMVICISYLMVCALVMVHRAHLA